MKKFMGRENDMGYKKNGKEWEVESMFGNGEKKGKQWDKMRKRERKWDRIIG